MGKSNVVLIGMPGAGKSTVGVLLAKRLGLDFLDTDVLLQARNGRRLQEILDREGQAAFRRQEEQILLDLPLSGTVIATGGSAIYSQAGMAALQRTGTLVFIDLPQAGLRQRIADMDNRGMVISEGQSFDDLYRERTPLYRHYADLVVEGTDKSVEALVTEIATRWSPQGTAPHENRPNKRGALPRGEKP
jgi:shikimate kinase